MYLAIDIGGTKTLVAALKEDGVLLESIRFETPKEYSNFLKVLSTTIKSLKNQDFNQVCSSAGRIDKASGLVLAFGNLSWENIDLAADIEAISNTPCLIENDSKLAGLSEAVLISKQYSKVLYITISTGIGSVLIVDGVIDKDLEDSEVGKMLLEHKGKFARWEEFASGKAIYEKYGKRASDINDPKIWYVIAHNIAIGMINLIASYTPQAIIIGGGVGTHLNKFQARLEEDLQIYSSPMFSIPPLLKAQRPEEAVIYGCYEFIKQHRKI